MAFWSAFSSSAWIISACSMAASRQPCAPTTAASYASISPSPVCQSIDSVEVGQCLFDVCVDVEVSQEGANSLGDIEAGAGDRLGHAVQGWQRSGSPFAPRRRPA